MSDIWSYRAGWRLKDRGNTIQNSLFVSVSLPVFELGCADYQQFTICLEHNDVAGEASLKDTEADTITQVRNKGVDGKLTTLPSRHETS